MDRDWASLAITPKQVEQLTALEVSDSFVGGILGGVYRPSVGQRWSGRLALIAIEATVAGLIFVFSLPIGFAIVRDSPVSDKWILAIAAGLTVLAMIGWNSYMRWQLQRLTRLMGLLDAVDHFNQMVQTGLLLHQFRAEVSQQQTLWSALELTRENLVNALVTEKLLRDNPQLRDRQAAFLSHLEGHLGHLQALEMSQQVQDYRRILHQALMINLSVQRQMERISRDSKLPK